MSEVGSRLMFWGEWERMRANWGEGMGIKGERGAWNAECGENYFGPDSSR